MTKRLEELFELNTDHADDIEVEQQEPETVSTDLISQETLDTIEKIEAALPQVRGLETSDVELDELAGMAKEAFTNLMDLGMQVDSRFSAEIFASAGTMLGHAITTRTAKVNKRLKMIDLQLKKAELDRKLSVQASKTEPEKTTLGEGKILDRNEILTMLLNKSKQEKDK